MFLSPLHVSTSRDLSEFKLDRDFIRGLKNGFEFVNEI